ncbi:terpene synthase family protein [Streptomyces sp. NPDC050211]|uniref:terpene synthase family protein n=1 Tax=Streptomyces sp. NPDC050211 TaxID=3154932 RepID=UPI003440E8DA
MPPAAGAAGPHGMRYPDLPDEPEARINPHYPAAARAAEEFIATCPNLSTAEREVLLEEDLGIIAACGWPLMSRDTLCASTQFLVTVVARDDRIDEGDTDGAAALDEANAHGLQRLLKTLPTASAQRVARAARAEAEWARGPCAPSASVEAYLEYMHGAGQQLGVELTAAGAGGAYTRMLDAAEAQEFMRLNADLMRLANDIVGAPREMSEAGARLNAVVVHQRLTGCTAQQALDACLELYHRLRERYAYERQELARREGFEMMCAHLHAMYCGLVFATKRSPRYQRYWIQPAR